MDTPASESSSSALDRRLLLGAAGLAGIAALASTRAKAGPLNPPAGVIASTGKTITEAQPRIALTAANTPGDADSVFRITQAGGYYLTANMIVPSGKNGIEVAASGVTIDLNGFQIGSFGGLAAIVASSTSLERITIRNGGIVNGTAGVSMSGVPRVALENLHVESSGAVVGLHSRVTDCVFSSGQSHGLECGGRSVVTRCVFENNAQTGLLVTREPGVESSAVITECVADGNGGEGFDAAGVISRCSAANNGGTGIYAYRGSTVIDCAASLNHTGFYLEMAAATGCSAHNNTTTGFYLSFTCRVSHCTADTNGRDSTSAAAAGFMILGIQNCLTDCLACSNIVGVKTAGLGQSHAFIARNTCWGNTTNWVVTAGNVCLVVVAAASPAFNGDSGGASPGSTNPNANYTFLS